MVLAVAGTTLARAGELAIDAGGELPFTRVELEDALRLRLGDGEARVKVEASGEDAVRVARAGKTRIVVLAGRRGAQAARSVALAVVDLAMTEPALPDLPSSSSSSSEP